ncbi:helix-turn-helix domain-containing protein [Desulforhopalus singaporensis]|uniref:Helix-turn-helix domain-containing protein n=1 Tax=Desulforhopalus singaporensis TaxID=91360 RepID=A0A1H0VLB6_9BACT|nr:helix-turn-helix domain-containing protein [Desulforhopalus singaporensis]SDP79008.1 Helix-turn-helix domain-containing protein [Desulforhopalus singaporensis]
MIEENLTTKALKPSVYWLYSIVVAGESLETVTKALGFTRTVIYQWIAKYREGGIDALYSRKAPGKQLQKLYRIIVE